MIGSLSLEEKNLIKDVRNLFRLEKRKTETTDTAMKNTKNVLRPVKD